MNFPDDNLFNRDRWELGKKLFYSQALSRDESINCAHCHDQSKAFSDGKIVSDGVDGLLGFRNSSSLANVGYHPYFTREGGVPTLELQIAVPIQEHAEFDFSIPLIVERLGTDSEILQMSLDAYDREFDAFVLTRALATFERSFISGSSLYDKVNTGIPGYELSDSEKRGFDLFRGEAQCISCHAGFNFTQYAFENNGLYLNYADSGRYRLTLNQSDIGKFKVPSLRNIELTAPYMHDGSFSTLEEVVNHYSEGINPHENLSASLENLYLSPQQKEDLVSFLKTLTDIEFISNKKFREE